MNERKKRREAEIEFLSEVLKGNAAAVDFCLLLGDISQSWDDFIDDKIYDEETINCIFIKALIELPANPFYRENLDELLTLIQSTVYDYITANTFEKGDEHDKTLAFVMRDSLVSIVTYCAWLIGGHAWAISQSPRIRRAFHDEKLSDYLRSIK